MILAKRNEKTRSKGEKRYCHKCKGEIPLKLVREDTNEKKQEVIQWYQCWKCGEYYPVTLKIEVHITPEKRELRLI